MASPDKFSIMLARFPGGSIMPIDMPTTTDYYARICHEMKTDPRCEGVITSWISDTPITMSRNLSVEQAKREKVTFLLMLDNDMSPDLDLGKDPFAEPFLKTSLDFVLKRWDSGPHLVGAPYCGPPPCENVFVFRWGTKETDNPAENDFSVDQFSREEATRKVGFELVAALPTGLILIDMRIFDRLKKPYFYYQWTTEDEYCKASTEDVTFTRNAGLAGGKVWVNWSAWAGHWKLKCVGKPKILFTEHMCERMAHAAKRGWSIADRKLILGEHGGDHIPKSVLEEPETGNASQEKV